MRCVCRLSLNWYLSKVSRAQAGAMGFKGKATVGEDRARHFPWRVRAASISSHCDASLRVLTVLLRNGRGRASWGQPGTPTSSLLPDFVTAPGDGKEVVRDLPWAMREEGPTSVPRATP